MAENTFSLGAFFARYLPDMLKALGTTLQLTGLSLLFGVLIGLVFGVLSVSRNKALRAIAQLYIGIIRGLPFIVLLYFIMYGVTSALNIQLPRYAVSVLTLSMNAGAYLAEIFRGGIEAVPPGQMEAARSLGLPYGKTMTKVILPQAVRIMIPSFINQFIITLKDTSILSAIGMVELVQQTKLSIAASFESSALWTLCGIMYIIIITVLSQLSKHIERRVKNNA